MKMYAFIRHVFICLNKITYLPRLHCYVKNVLCKGGFTREKFAFRHEYFLLGIKSANKCLGNRSAILVPTLLAMCNIYSPFSIIHSLFCEHVRKNYKTRTHLHYNNKATGNRR